MAPGTAAGRQNRDGGAGGGKGQGEAGAAVPPRPEPLCPADSGEQTDLTTEALYSSWLLGQLDAT